MKVLIAVLLLIDAVAPDVCRVTGSSKGFNDAGCDNSQRAECTVLNLCGTTYKPFEQTFVTGILRGIAVMKFNPIDCTVTEGQTFDIHGDSARVQPFKDYVNGMTDGTTIIIATADEYTQLLSPDFSFLRTLGSPQSGIHEYRSSLTIFARKVNGNWCTIGADYKASTQGPAAVDVRLAEMAGINC